MLAYVNNNWYNVDINIESDLFIYEKNINSTNHNFIKH